MCIMEHKHAHMGTEEFIVSQYYDDRVHERVYQVNI